MYISVTTVWLIYTGRVVHGKGNTSTSDLVHVSRFSWLTVDMVEVVRFRDDEARAQDQYLGTNGWEAWRLFGAQLG